MCLRLQALTPVDGALPQPLLERITALYASNAEFWRLTGDFPDPDRVGERQVAASLNAELTHPAAEVLLASDESDRLVALACVLHEHPDPIDTYPWIGLLLVDGALHGQGHGGAAARLVESRLAEAGRDGVRLAVQDGNRRGLAFWTALGYRAIDHREDRQAGRPCLVLHKDLPAA